MTDGPANPTGAPRPAVHATSGHIGRPDAPTEGDVAALLELSRPLTVEGLSQLRTTLGDQAGVILAFALRRAKTALGDNDAQAALDAAEALTLVDPTRVDPRDLAVDLPLLALRDTDADVEAVVRRTVERADPGLAGRIRARRAALSTATLASAGQLAVPTEDGNVLIDHWLGRDVQPVRVAQATLALARAIDAEGSYRSAPVHTATLPEVWFDAEAPVADVPSRGGASFRAGHVEALRPLSHSLLVFVAELPSPADAARAAERAASATTERRPRIAVTLGPYLALIIGGSLTIGEGSLETVDSLRRFEPLAHTALEGLRGS